MGIKAAGKSCVESALGFSGDCSKTWTAIGASDWCFRELTRRRWLLVQMWVLRGRKCTHLLFSLAESKGVFLPVVERCQTQSVRQFLHFCRSINFELVCSASRCWKVKQRRNGVLCRKCAFSLLLAHCSFYYYFWLPQKLTSVYIRGKRETERREKMTTILMPIIT